MEGRFEPFQVRISLITLSQCRACGESISYHLVYDCSIFDALMCYVAVMRGAHRRGVIAAIEMLVNGEIVKYRYDAESEEIVPR